MAQNPMLNEKAFRGAEGPELDGPEGLQLVRGQDVAQNMTLQGTINKTFLLLFICVVGGMMSWSNPQAWATGATGIILAIAAFVVALITCFKPAISMITAPIYALLEGLLLGAVSAAYNAQFHGIVFQAVAITILVFFVMLGMYRFQVIRVTDKVVKIITSATLAIAIFYIVSIVARLFGANTSYLTSSSPLSIGISVVICLVAAFNFLVDFEFINRMTNQYSTPKYMEWYAGFGLLVTLVWLYLEILRLLGKARSR